MSLKQCLADCLPEGKRFEILHLQNPPVESHPVITPDQTTNHSKITTIKNQHFLVLFHEKKAVFALEVYVYITLFSANFESYNEYAERLIFVSKADTNGYCDCPISFKRVTKHFISYLLKVDPNYYLQKVIPKHGVDRDFGDGVITRATSTQKALRILSKRLNGKEPSQRIPHDNYYLRFRCESTILTKICLFTRPAPQYLFAKSSKNPKKHLLDGSKLLKWWLDILDDLVVEEFSECTDAKLRIPGEDDICVGRYLDGLKYLDWKVGDIFSPYPVTKDSIAAFSIPLLPDDPKSRFLHQLVDEGRIHKTDLLTFWTELQERQEFRLSFVVSVMGVRGHTRDPPNYQPHDDENDVLLALSKKQFNYLKSYVTGEEYDTKEGAFESYMNVSDYMNQRLNRNLLKVEGSARALAAKIERKRANQITTLSVRKKVKERSKGT